MSTLQVYQWQQDAWRYFTSLQSRLPHAFLLHGPAGTGKRHFAERMAKALLCETPDAEGQACGHCGSCGWFDQYSHPDYRRIRPEVLDEDEGSGDAEAEAATAKSSRSKAPSKEIVIHQIRALAEMMNISTHRNGKRVIVLYPAEAMNIPAANALLKSLEEPHPNTVFILVSDSLDKLLPTIVSRCHQLALGMPTRDAALAWLQQQGVADAANWLALQGGAPLAAMEIAGSEQKAELETMLGMLAQPSADLSLKLADKLQKTDLPLVVSWLQRWVYDVFSVKQTGIIRYYPRYDKEIRSLASRCNLHDLMRLSKSLGERQAIASHPLSPKLFLEDVFLEYASAFSS
ncbi:DNA polymerase III subunit delta' [Undibacterium squillarum]|uniref:DNA polymerase III subunit delta' n=1 Tax=Undibacterium squillarum TaxID=1131567 RepID=UPI0035AE536A